MENNKSLAYYNEESKRLSELIKEGKLEEVLAKFGLSFLYSLDGEARIMVEQYLKIEQKSAVDLYNFGVLALQKKELKEAEKFFKKAIELDPEYATPHYNLALLYENKADETKAQKEWRRFIELEEAYREEKGLRINCESDEFEFIVEAKNHELEA